jgi:putative hydrolase of the HAD superfamily
MLIMSAADEAESVLQLSGVRAVILDLDDTLYPERSYAFSGFDAVADWLRERMTCSFDPAARMKEFFETEARHRVFNELLQELSPEDLEHLVPLMIECYRNHRPALQLHPDAAEALDRWAGFRLGLISDGPVIMQQRKLEALGLHQRFDFIVLTDVWGREYWKPHPRAFREAERLLGTGGPACTYIADNCAKDFVAPRSLGWRTVCVRRPGGIYLDAVSPRNGHADHVVSSLGQINISS